MDLHLLTNTWYFTYLIVPLLIMCSRICDVTIGTMRIIFISRGKKNLAPFLGFFEVMIWLTAMSQVMKNVNNPITYIAYGVGFAIGNYVGMIIEEKLALGNSIIRMISHKDMTELKDNLTDSGYGITTIEGLGARGKVNILFTVINRKDMKDVVSIIEKNGEHIFYSIEDAKGTSDGVFPQRTSTADMFLNRVINREKSQVGSTID